MPISGWDSKLSATTRGRIITLLRRASRTVEDLAGELGLTDNALRVHLTTLERDGLVRQAGVRRGGGAGKPATVYELAPGVEPLFSRAYLPLLTKLLETLADHMTAEELQNVMRDVGRRLAAGQVIPPADLGNRVKAAAALLTELGGLTSVEKRDGGFVIRGCGCPLSAVVAERPEVCGAVETLLSVVTGAEVHEHCDRSARPQCAFHVGAPAASAR